MKEIYVGERRRKETMNVDPLMKQLKEDGQITAITLRPVADYDKENEDYGGEPYALVAGGRRYEAALMLGWKEIEATSRENMPELRHRVLELHENLHREDMSWQEVVDAKREILELRRQENPKITQAEVAKEIGDDAGNFSRDVQVSEAMGKRPSLKNSSSKKQALRVSKVMDHEEKRQARLKKEEKEGKKIESIGIIEQGDARLWLGELEEGSIDLVLTDPPYGIDYWKGGHKMTATPGQNLGVSEYDDSAEEANDLLHISIPLIVRALRPTGWLAMFAGRELLNLAMQLVGDTCAVHYAYREYATETLYDSGGEPIVRWKLDEQGNRIGTNKCHQHEVSEEKCRFLVPEAKPWIWYRPGSRNRSRYPELHAQNLYEDILICNMGNALLAKECGNVIEVEPDYSNKRIHANQKPVELAVELVERLSHIGDLVVDPTAGSGALLAGALKKSRRAKGVDLNENIVLAAQGMVAEYWTPTPDSTAELGERRRKEQMERNMIGLNDFSEIEGNG